MQKQVITLEQVEELNGSLHFFLTHVLVEAPALIPPSYRATAMQWLDAHFPFNIRRTIQVDESVDDEESLFSRLSHSVLCDVYALFHFYEVAQSSYEPMAPIVSRCLFSARKEENALSSSIKIGHLSFEMANILYLLMQHGQFLLIISNWYPYIQQILDKKSSVETMLLADHLNFTSSMQVEKNKMLLITDIVFYRSMFWIFIYSMTFAYYIKILYDKNYSIKSFIKLAAIKNKINSYLSARYAETRLNHVKENYLLISCMLGYVSNKENAMRRDWLSWFDDMSSLLLPTKNQSEVNSVDHLTQLYDIVNIIQSHLSFSASRCLARVVVKLVLITLIIQTILSPKSYAVDFSNTAPSNQLSYGFLPWILHQGYPSDYFPPGSYYFTDLSSITPLIYYMELKLWTWFLTPIVAGIIEASFLSKMSFNYLHHSKEHFRKNVIDVLRVGQSHHSLMLKTHKVNDFICPVEKAKKLKLIDTIITIMHLHFHKPFLSGASMRQQFFQVPSHLEGTLHQLAFMAYKLLKMIFSISATAARFVMISVIESLPNNRCRRMTNAANAWKKNHLELYPKKSGVTVNFFAPKQESKNSKAASFRYRAPTL